MIWLKSEWGKHTLHHQHNHFFRFLSKSDNRTSKCHGGNRSTSTCSCFEKAQAWYKAKEMGLLSQRWCWPGKFSTWAKRVLTRFFNSIPIEMQTSENLVDFSNVWNFFVLFILFRLKSTTLRQNLWPNYVQNLLEAGSSGRNDPFRVIDFHRLFGLVSVKNFRNALNLRDCWG